MPGPVRFRTHGDDFSRGSDRPTSGRQAITGAGATLRLIVQVTSFGAGCLVNVEGVEGHSYCTHDRSGT